MSNGGEERACVYVVAGLVGKHLSGKHHRISMLANQFGGEKYPMSGDLHWFVFHDNAASGGAPMKTMAALAVDLIRGYGYDAKIVPHEKLLEYALLPEWERQRCRFF